MADYVTKDGVAKHRNDYTGSGGQLEAAAVGLGLALEKLPRSRGAARPVAGDWDVYWGLQASHATSPPRHDDVTRIRRPRASR